MSYLEDDKEVEFGRPKDPRKRWKRQAKRDERKRKRKSKDPGKISDAFNTMRIRGLFGSYFKPCSTCHNQAVAQRRAKRARRKRNRHWGT